jgi:hypothetical protein
MDTPALGDRVRDRVTGLSGIMVGISYWLAGCARGAIQPETSKAGKAPESFWVDVPLLVVVKKGVIPQTVVHPGAPARPTESESRKDRTGGPRPDAQRQLDPARR